MTNSKALLTFLLASVSLDTFAQSSVTLFGTIDAGLNYTSNAGGHSAVQMASIDQTISRWGLKGTEDLGGGLNAIFDLESGFNLESGTSAYGSRLFGYQSYVGLQSDRFGTLTFGRQTDVITDTVGLLTANGNWAGWLFSHPLDNDNTDTTYHVNNAVKWTSPAFNGVTSTMLIGLGNQAGSFAQNRVLSAGVNYSYESLSLAAAVSRLTNPGSTSNGAIASDDYLFQSAAQTIYGIGANYGIGHTTFGLVYTHANVDQAKASLYAGDLGTPAPDIRFDNVEVNLKYDVTPTLFVGGMATYSRAHVNRGGLPSTIHWNQIGLMSQYSLSKRTTCYLQAVYQRVSGNDSSTLSAAAIPGSAGISSNNHQIVMRIAMTHSF
ncbi:porin [Paraburkholderia sp. BL25I1N1]|uniref:porin n=1 Tax=Paraburkholderia sp. BL25I1N1 TaxID=1938804 RepID=UPI000D409A76|nr:porin [Paraburkholderia sp. BL25I1N1]PRX92042.1 putative porin [Paraburkholderia sp. BL25I1N1]